MIHKIMVLHSNKLLKFIANIFTIYQPPNFYAHGLLRIKLHRTYTLYNFKSN